MKVKKLLLCCRVLSSRGQYRSFLSTQTHWGKIVALGSVCRSSVVLSVHVLFTGNKPQSRYPESASSGPQIVLAVVMRTKAELKSNRRETGGMSALFNRAFPPTDHLPVCL